jgi:hypothetical protein
MNIDLYLPSQTINYLYMKKIVSSIALIFIVLSIHAQKQTTKSDSLTLQKILKEVTSIKKNMTTDSIPVRQKAADSLLKVVSIGIIGKSENINTANFGEFISVRVNNLDTFLRYQNSFRRKGVNDSLSEIILYINGNPMRDIGVWSVNSTEQSLIFHLDRHSPYLTKLYPFFPYLWSKIHVYVSAGFRNGVFLGTEGKANAFYLHYIDNSAWVLTFLMVVATIVSFLFLAIRTNLIRIGNDKSPFSLSLTQLAFWTLIIASSFLYIWVITGEIPSLTGSTLVLLSISIGTTGGSKLVDIRRDVNTPDNMPPSGGFFKDVLSDSLGYSVHRSQMFLWTIILGIIFVSDVITKQKMPQLDATLLGLMGISSTAYVGLKTIENKPGEEQLPDKVKQEQA